MHLAWALLPIRKWRNKNEKAVKITSFLSNTLISSSVLQILDFFVQVHVSVQTSLFLYHNDVKMMAQCRLKRKRKVRGERRSKGGRGRIYHLFHIPWAQLTHLEDSYYTANKKLMQKLCILPFISIELHESGKVEKLLI